MRAVVLCKDNNIVRVYENLGIMAKHQDISLATAYQRVRPTTKPMDGYKFWFEDQYLERHPDKGAALEKAKEDMIVAMDKSNKKIKEIKKEDKAVDNELELDGTSATVPKKGKRKMKKAVPTELEMENKEEPSKPEPPKTQPAADISEGWVLEETAEAHPEYFGNGKLEELMEQIEKDESCWRRMSDILGPARMSVYAHCEALRHLLMAKDKPEEYANNMRRVAYYSSMAASMANRLEDKANG